MEFINKLLDTADYPARWNCGNWGSFEGWLHIVSDASIAGAYLIIPLIIYYFVKTLNGAIPKVFSGMSFYFVAFIFFCGIGHLLDAVMFYYPAYRLLGVIKAVTAVSSWLTVLVLIRFVPRLFSLKTDDQFNLLAEELNEITKEKDSLTERNVLVDTLLEEATNTNKLIVNKLKEFDEKQK